MDEALQGDSEHVQNIMISLEEREEKHDTGVGDGTETVSLWTSADSQLGHFEVLQEGIKVKSPTEDPSLAEHEIGDNSNDQILHIKHELTDSTELKQDDHESPEDTSESMLPGDEIGEGDMLRDVDGVGTILDDGTGTIPVSGDLTHPSSVDVIQMLLPTTDEAVQNEDNSLQSLKTMCSDVFSSPTQTIQAITLADGNTAFIQHSGGSKFLEGQTITLEDGSTAIVQPMPDKFNLMTSLGNQGVVQTNTIDSNGIHLHQDTTAGFLNQAVKDGLQAIILEDGTTAYLATQQQPGGGLIDNAQLEATTLTLDQLTSTIGSNGVLTNGIMNMKSLPTCMAGGSEVTVSQEGLGLKDSVVQLSSYAEKVGPFLEKAYKCSFEGCGKYYTTLHHLKVHERSHTGDRPFKCDFEECGKAFATGYGLKSHTRVHTGEKPYKCQDEGCEKAFKTSGDLQKHMRTHTGERPFKCPFEGCTRSFTTSNIRKVHIRTHTGERPYICPEEGCGRAFASATNYKNHIRIHTGEKPYVCTVIGCGKRFTEYSSLYKHHVVHTHAKPYTCSRCGKTYRQTSTLAMHKRTAHGEDVTAESEALLFQEQSQADGMEPVGKRLRLSMVNQDAMMDEGEGTLVINTSDVSQHLAYIGTNGIASTADILQSPLSNESALLQHGVTLTLSDQGQQVFVITDPAQLEALQQIAKHQLENEDDIEPLLMSVENPQHADTNTMVTEISSESEPKYNTVTLTNASETYVMNK